MLSDISILKSGIKAKHRDNTDWIMLHDNANLEHFTLVKKVNGFNITKYELIPIYKNGKNEFISYAEKERQENKELAKELVRQLAKAEQELKK